MISAETILRPKVDAIPVGLRARHQWVLWRIEERDGKPTKVPYSARSGAKASTTASGTWSSFEQVVARYEDGGYDGIGYVFSENDPYTGIDLDKCRDAETGKIEAWATEIIERLDSYTEASVSGGGAHVIVEGRLPSGRRRQGDLEMYDAGRYFTFSGHVLGDRAAVKERQEELDALHRATFPEIPSGGAETNGQPKGFLVSATPSDDELLAQARAAQNGKKFSALFDDGSTKGYNSHSEGDLALCSILAFWTINDPQAIDRLFRQSKLYRPKWDEKHGGATYGHLTIEKALSSAKPQVRLSTDLARMLDKAEQALSLLRTPQLFQRGRILVKIAREGARSVPGLDRPKRAPFVCPLSVTHLRELLSRAARFVRPKKDGELVPVLAPRYLADGVFHRGEWNLPVLDGLVEVPTLRPDGTVLDTPGYDPASGMYLDPGSVRFPPIPARPTHEDARRAIEQLREPFCDFPYKAPVDLATTLAALLTVVGRTAIAGAVPMFALRSTTPGSGKGLQADVISLIATGRPAPITIATKDSEEMRKALLTVAMEGHPLVLFDNVEGAFGSSVLAATITALEVSGRVLGLLKNATVPMRVTWLLTGNNVVFRGDLGRRVVPSDLEPNVEYPEDRTDFRHPDLREYVLQQRPALVAAALTVLRAYAVAGYPSHGRPAFGSFESWDQLVRGALIWTTGVDPLATRERVRQDGDSDLEVLRALLLAWDAAFGTESKTLKEAIKAAETNDDLKDALAGFDRKGGEKLDARSIGKSLRNVIGRIVRGRRLETPGERGGRKTYCVVAVGKEDPCTQARDHERWLGGLGGFGSSPPPPNSPGSETRRDEPNHLQHLNHLSSPVGGADASDSDHPDHLLDAGSCSATPPFTIVEAERECNGCLGTSYVRDALGDLYCRGCDPPPGFADAAQ